MKNIGVIIRGVGGFYDVVIDNETVRCSARGKFRIQGITPMVGDYAELSKERRRIHRILPRKNQLIRPPAANIDYLGIVIAVRQPEPDFGLVDKLMISAEMNEIKPLLIINKTDLAEKDDIQKIIDAYKATEYCILRASYDSPEYDEALKAAIKDGITVFAGQSGVGKSSIINRLHPKFSLETGDLSHKIERGRHTTRNVELLNLPYGGMVVDTPGFSTMDLTQLQPDEVYKYYSDFIPYDNQCRFPRCIHHREPDCIIKKKIDEGLISRERYDRYIRIIEEIKETRRDRW